MRSQLTLHSSESSWTVIGTFSCRAPSLTARGSMRRPSVANFRELPNKYTQILSSYILTFNSVHCILGGRALRTAKDVQRAQFKHMYKVRLEHSNEPRRATSVCKQLVCSSEVPRVAVCYNLPPAPHLWTRASTSCTSKLLLCTVACVCYNKDIALYQPGELDDLKQESEADSERTTGVLGAGLPRTAAQTRDTTRTWLDRVWTLTPNVGSTEIMFVQPLRCAWSQP